MRALHLAVACLLCLPALAADSFNINVYPCPKAEPAPTLDGRPDEAAWEKAPLVSGFTAFETDKLVPQQTSFRVLWDERCLYFGIRCEEPLMAKVNPIKYAHDEHAVFSSETIELFIDPNHTHDLYYQLATNVTASLYDGEREVTVWNSDATVKSFMGNDFWSLEIAVPWKTLGRKPEPGAVVGFNVNRDRNIGDKSWSTWARVQGGFHDPQRFAHLVLSGTPEMIGKLSRELRKGDRSGAIVVYSPEGFSQSSYAGLAATSLKDLNALMAELRAECRRERDPAAAAELQKRLDDFDQQVRALEQQAQGSLNAADWARLDLAMQQLVLRLGKVVWEARLTALLGSI